MHLKETGPLRRLDCTELQKQKEELLQLKRALGRSQLPAVQAVGQQLEELVQQLGEVARQLPAGSELRARVVAAQQLLTAPLPVAQAAVGGLQQAAPLQLHQAEAGGQQPAVAPPGGPQQAVAQQHQQAEVLSAPAVFAPPPQLPPEVLPFPLCTYLVNKIIGNVEGTAQSALSEQHWQM